MQTKVPHQGARRAPSNWTRYYRYIYFSFQRSLCDSCCNHYSIFHPGVCFDTTLIYKKSHGKINALISRFNICRPCRFIQPTAAPAPLDKIVSVTAIRYLYAYFRGVVYMHACRIGNTAHCIGGKQKVSAGSSGRWSSVPTWSICMARITVIVINSALRRECEPTTARTSVLWFSVPVQVMEAPAAINSIVRVGAITIIR